MPSRRSGFTLIELLVVVLIIGILAAIAIPRYSSVRLKANVTTMKTDLRNLVTSEEGHLAETGTYYGGPVPAAGTPFASSPGVTLTITEASTSGWAATATHAGAAGWTCAVFIGPATPPAPATEDGVIVCQKP